jgi:hypothetical protein
MAPRQRRIVTQTSADELSPSPSVTSSKSSEDDTTTMTTTTMTTTTEDYHNTSMEYRTKEDIDKEDHDLFNLVALVRVNGSGEPGTVDRHFTQLTSLTHAHMDFCGFCWWLVRYWSLRHRP